jgi:hypothetical protein
MIKYKRIIARGGLFCLMGASLLFCSTPDKKRSSDDDDGGSNSPESALNDSISGSYTLDDAETDTSISVGSDQSGHAEAHRGGTLNVAIQFQAPNGNVIGGGIRFGETGPIQVVSIPEAQGQTSGVLNFAIQIPASVCDNLSQICHDIKCYEFAVTDIGKVSVANINAVAGTPRVCSPRSKRRGRSRRRA